MALLIELAGAVALLLWGTRMVQSGMTRAYGADLRAALDAATRSRVRAALTGIGVTTLLQSSTATSLMTASFAGRGLLATAPALAVVLGADLGTTLVAQVLSVGVGILSPIFLIAGVALHASRGRSRRRELGRVLIGFGLLLLALRLLSQASQPLQESAALQGVLASLYGDALFALLIGALATWLLHSSLAFILVAASLAGDGVIGVDFALLLALGANLGGALPAVVATARSAPAARRVPFGNLVFRLAGCLVALPLLPSVGGALALVEAAPLRQVVDFHTAFNLALLIGFIGLTGPVARLCEKLLPDPPPEEDEGKPRYLDDALIDTPSLALAAASREVLRMADILERMVSRSLNAFGGTDQSFVAEVEDMDDDVDRLYEAIKLYCTKIGRVGLGEEDSRRCAEILSFTTNLEHVGDIIDKNLMELATKKIRHKSTFSAEGWKEICRLHEQVLDNLRLAIAVFISGDLAAARRLVAEKVRFRNLEREAGESHLERLRRGNLESMKTSALHLDILRDLKRINSHFTSVAYPILEEAGELRSSRLRGDADTLSAE